MKIMVALDGSAHALKALDQALRLARAESAEVLLFSVSALVGTIDEMPENIREKLVRTAESYLAEGKRRAEEAGVPATSLVVQGNSPAQAIVEQAEESGVDLIVMGSKGKSNLERFLTGSVAQSVATHSKCSLLIVK